MTTLQGVMPGTVAAYNALSDYAASQGITIGVANYGGIRTLSDTTKILQFRQDDYNAAVRAGQIAPDTTLNQFRPIAPFGSSYHNYGAAFDVQIIARPGNMSESQALAILGAFAPSIGLRWGGTFPQSGHPADPPHFEVAVSLAQAKAMYADYINSGGAQPPSSSPFDISSFLPGLTTGDDSDIQAALDAPASDVPADDSGDIALAYGPEQGGGSTGLLVLGLFVAGLLAFAIRRKFQ